MIALLLVAFTASISSPSLYFSQSLLPLASADSSSSTTLHQGTISSIDRLGDAYAFSTDGNGASTFVLVTACKACTLGGNQRAGVATSNYASIIIEKFYSGCTPVCVEIFHSAMPLTSATTYQQQGYNTGQLAVTLTWGEDDIYCLNSEHTDIVLCSSSPRTVTINMKLTGTGDMIHCCVPPLVFVQHSSILPGKVEITTTHTNQVTERIAIPTVSITGDFSIDFSNMQTTGGELVQTTFRSTENTVINWNRLQYLEQESFTHFFFISLFAGIIHQH